MSEETLKFFTSDFIPCKDADLMWIFIDAPGKPAMDPTKPNRKLASLYADEKAAQPLIDAIDEFWDDNKGKGWKCKSKGYTPEKVLKEGGDKGNEDDYVKSGRIIFNFWTGANWPDGNDRVIDIYNAKGNKVSLGSKKIGNGSKGAISGTMAIYDSGLASRGVTLYLNAIQLTKFVEFSQDAGFGAQEEDEDAFMGVDSEFEGTIAEEQSEAKPRL